MADPVSDVEAYIAGFPEQAQEVLREIRRTIFAVLPDAGETISYHIPTVTMGGQSLVHYAGWKHHVSLYPLPVDLVEAQPYLSGAATAKFPFAKPIPYALIGRIALALAQRH
jgi:uncharacterized protein YdhG (YjbR/CyaY superfamily)